MIKYLGSKRTLVPRIEQIVRGLPVASACDLFAGTTRVAQALRGLGLRVVANNLASYSEAFGRAHVERAERGRIPELLAALGAAEPRRGYVTEIFCETARYFQPENGIRIDGIRAAIDGLELDPVERGTLLTALLEAADRVDSTVGLQMAYLKDWAPRARQPRSSYASRGSAQGRRGRRRASTRTSSRAASTGSISPTSTRHTISTPTTRTTTSERRSSAATRRSITAPHASASTGGRRSRATTRVARRGPRSRS